MKGVVLAVLENDLSRLDRPADWPQGGDQANFKLILRSIALKNQAARMMVEPGVTIVVGANNAGKSTFLTEINDAFYLAQGDPRAKIVASVELKASGDQTDFAHWLATRGVYNPKMNPNLLRLRGSMISQREFHELWDKMVSSPAFISHVTHAFVSKESVVSRINQIASSPPSEANGREHPLHILRDEPLLMRKLNSYCERVFRIRLTLDWISDEHWTLRMGEIEGAVPTVYEVDHEFVGKLGELEPLETQGDGLKNFVGLLLPILTRSSPIVLLDEPEAFLHPPQAKTLGSILGELAIEQGVQIVLATHDRNVLLGVLQSGSRTSVIRLSREPDEPLASQLSAEGVLEMWADASLRYSNALEAVFHRAVILCEGDADCKFISAALDYYDRQSAMPFPVADVLFVPVNGKGGFSRIVRALSAINTPIVVCGDIDVLNDRRLVARLVDELGGDFSGMRGDYTTLARHITNSGGESVISWESFKVGGIALLSGEARVAADKLLAALDAAGVVLIEQGTLERLGPDIELRKGPEWLASAFEREAFTKELPQAFVKRLVDVLSRRLAPSDSPVSGTEE